MLRSIFRSVAPSGNASPLASQRGAHHSEPRDAGSRSPRSSSASPAQAIARVEPPASQRAKDLQSKHVWAAAAPAAAASPVASLSAPRQLPMEDPGKWSASLAARVALGGKENAPPGSKQDRNTLPVAAVSCADQEEVDNAAAEAADEAQNGPAPDQARVGQHVPLDPRAAFELLKDDFEARVASVLALGYGVVKGANTQQASSAGHRKQSSSGSSSSYTVFKFFVRTTGGFHWVVYTRYSSALKLRGVLEKIGLDQQLLPKLPARRPGFLGHGKSFLQQRARELARWMLILAHRVLEQYRQTVGLSESSFKDKKLTALEAALRYIANDGPDASDERAMCAYTELMPMPHPSGIMSLHARSDMDLLASTRASDPNSSSAQSSPDERARRTQHAGSGAGVQEAHPRLFRVDIRSSSGQS